MRRVFFVQIFHPVLPDNLMKSELFSTKIVICVFSCSFLIFSDRAMSQSDEKGEGDNAGSDRVAEVMKNYKGRGVLADGSKPTPVDEALKLFKMRKGFEIESMAAEPKVGQPLFMTWDSKGRLWVSQYLQYQFPAGLKIVEYDNHLRAQFDKVPQPPPYGTKGADKITIFEDTNGDGTFDKNTDAITGLNISTSVAIGAGGIWVANPPYLLYYPDGNGDGIPDSDPQVRLSGFGIEDTHSVMNSLEWGPDGWLYGVNGSTTTGKVKDPVTGKMVKWQGQMVWRYHPDLHSFEIYGEGGGNTFSLEIDAKGRVFSGTNHGSRGMYYPQGSYGEKGWGKHGPLTNPYAFGYFKHLEHEGDKRRFSQAYCIYEGGLYPKEFDGKIISPNSLHNVVWVSERIPKGSSYRTVDEANMVETSDHWFRPVFAGVGPDGCVYMGDWYDSRLSHVRPVDDWHKDSGRVYRIKPTGTKPSYKAGDLSKLPPAELIALFKSPNRWIRRRAVLELGWREEKSTIPDLKKLVDTGAAQESLEALWALNLLGGLSDELAAKWLAHKDEHVQRWVIRLVGDRRMASSDLAKALIELAGKSNAPQVRSQLASSAKRLPAGVGVPIVSELVKREADLEDIHLPLMYWWAVEGQAESGRAEVQAWVADANTWKGKIFREEIAARLMKRYAMDGGDENFASCAFLLKNSPDDETTAKLMDGLEAAFQGIPMPKLPSELSSALDEYSKKLGESGLVLRMKKGEAGALAEAQKAIVNASLPVSVRSELIKQIGATEDPKVVASLLRIIGSGSDSALKRVALQELARFDDPKIATTILGRYGSTLPAEHGVRSTAERVLAGRPEWSKLMLDKVDLAVVKDRDVSPDVVQLMMTHGDKEIDKRVAEHWPGIASGSGGVDLLKETARLKGILAKGKGDPMKGKATFTARCAVCHKLFGEGGEIGPDLTGYERHNPEFWIHGIVNPSLEIREEFVQFVASMTDGRKIAGLVIDQNPQTVTLRDVANQESILARSDMEKLQASKISLMPPALLTGIADQDMQDFFAYIMAKTKPE